MELHYLDENQMPLSLAPIASKVKKKHSENCMKMIITLWQTNIEERNVPIFNRKY